MKTGGQGTSMEYDKWGQRRMYWQVVDRQEAKLSVGVGATVPAQARWELQFLLNILPVYVYRVKKTEWPLEVEVEIEPKMDGIVVDPSQIYFRGTNRERVPPDMFRQDDRFLGTNAPGPPGVTNPTRLRLEFRAPHGGYLDQDSPFEISVEGIRIPGQNSPLPPILFEPITVIRPGFRLPY